MKKPTIYEALLERLGREPTRAEIRTDILRIIAEGAAEGLARVRARRTKTQSAR